MSTYGQTYKERRDLFAAAALTGLLAGRKEGWENNRANRQGAATIAAGIADAMLAALDAESKETR